MAKNVFINILEVNDVWLNGIAEIVQDDDYGDRLKIVVADKVTIYLCQEEIEDMLVLFEESVIVDEKKIAKEIYALFPSDVFSGFGRGIVLGVLIKYLKAHAKSAREEALRENEEIEVSLRVVLDAVDYMAGNCRVNEMVGAVLPKVLIEKARKALMEKGK